MSRRQLFVATLALLAANFMGGLDATIVNTALPAITSDLNGIRLIGWVSSIFLLGTAVTTVLWGRVGEVLGNKKTFQLAMMIFVVSSFLGGLSTNMVFLIVMRALMGIGAGGMTSIPFIIYADLYPNPAERARAIGWVTAAFTLSNVVGPIIGGWLVDGLSWHWVFFINVPIGLIALLMLQLSYHDMRKPQQAQHFDYLGSAVLVVMLVLLLFASDSLASSFARAGILAILGIFFAIGFYFIEKRQGDKALIPVELLKDMRIQSQNVIMFLLNGFFIGYSIYAPMWAQGLLGTNATLGGMTQIGASILLLIGTRTTANLMTHIPYKRIVAMGSLSVLISAIMMIIANKQAPYLYIILSGCFEGLGVGLAFAPMQVSIQDGVRESLIGISTTFGLLFRTLGQTFMSAIFGATLSLSTLSQVHGLITGRMINKLTDASTARTLPAHLLPQLRTILFNGLHMIMLIGLCLVITALIINFIRKEPVRQERGGN